MWLILVFQSEKLIELVGNFARRIKEEFRIQSIGQLQVFRI